MTSKPPTDADRDRTPPSDDELLRLQREANEKLVLATLRAHEDADSAREDQASAENATRAVERRRAELQATAELRDVLIGVLGHDLRSPLNTVLLASSRLVELGSLGDEGARLVQRITASGERMARLTTQLLDFTRARLGDGFDLTLAPADLGAICQDIAEELRIGTSSEVLLALEDDLRGHWDADRLAQAISNIAGNAIDHATPGTPVVVRAHDDGMIVVAITNQGAPIPPEVLPTIFKAFRKARAGAGGKRAAGHLGLGLYIASEIARAHGGTLDARSEGGATTFTLRLPHDATRPEKPAGEPPAP
jgi:signal transduction histidine kinase